VALAMAMGAAAMSTESRHDLSDFLANAVFA